MALNCSRRLFDEDNLVSPMRMGSGYRRVEGGAPERTAGGDGCGAGWVRIGNGGGYRKEGVPERTGGDVDGRDGCDCCANASASASATQDSSSKDILDLLPSDPFGMGMDLTNTVTAITGWLQDLDGCQMDEHGQTERSYQLFAELNFVWNSAMMFHAFPGGNNTGAEERNALRRQSGSGESSQGGGGAVSCNFDFGRGCDSHDMSGSGRDYKDVAMASVSGETKCVDDSNCLGGDDLAPHPALSFCLSYLGLSDLLVAGQVCKYLHSTVQGDPLLWRSIHIDQPLNERITDDVLLQLTSRAQGNLQCLSLVECTRITDDGLNRVLEANPKLIKLSVPGCTRLSIEGIVGILRVHNSRDTQRVKHLHIGGLYGVTQKHFEELKILLGTDSQLQQQHPHKPHFYRRGNLYLSCDDDQAIDIEVCPRCQNLRLVYDCPAEGCQVEGHTTQLCRACTLCIPRCSQCGRCINDSEYEETFCLELLCSSCSEQLVKCSERTDRKVGPSNSFVIDEQS